MAGIAGLFVGLLLVQTANALPPFGGKTDRAARGGQGYLGINFRDVGDDQLSTLKLKEARGAEITVLDHDGPGCKSGLLAHDVILQMNGQVVEGEEQLRRMLREMPAGRTVNFVISRDGQQQTISSPLADRNTIGEVAWGQHITVPDPEAQHAESSWHGKGFFGPNAPSSSGISKHSFMGTTTVLSSSYTGAMLEMMGPQLSDYFGAPGGLLVRAVDPNSPAAVAGMHAGDVVIKVDSILVTSSADWLKTVHANRGNALAVIVLRDKKEQILSLTPDSKKRSSVVPIRWPGTRSETEALSAMVRSAGMQ